MTDLDDFFAKKDRKKSKGKKYATSEEVAKKLEDKDTIKKVDKPLKKERILEGEEGGAPLHEQDEWREFEEEKKDYTGLKIGNLSINLPEGTPGNAENFSEQQQGDESGSEVDRKAGPWKKLDSETAEVEVQKKTEPVIPAPAPIQPSTPNVYVPPVMRNSQQQQHQQQLSASRLRSKMAPDIHNEEYFPSLTGAKGEQRRNKNEGTFEVVAPSKASSHRQLEQSKFSNQGPKLSLGNRFNTLSNDS
ncbi:hypothetical protein PPYR_00377 [Photinus pyralis]|uniref:Protein CDV3 homolog n=1 Tax=Photinus pyralis TaxID=7054 RepID=A0A1Y1K1Y0_PHOPY|nr:protein CDV3 homolog [Photinus pyralis]KAB0803407.1 hypothetical protein PPYR_00377 [Photinus pyralis]